MQSLTEEIKLSTVYLFILSPLSFDILRYHFLVTTMPDRIDVISTRPKISTPQHFLYAGMLLKYLFASDTRYCLYNIFRSHHRHTLYQEMHMILVNSYFHKMDLVPFTHTSFRLSDTSFVRTFLPYFAGHTMWYNNKFLLCRLNTCSLTSHSTPKQSFEEFFRLKLCPLLAAALHPHHVSE